MKKYAKNLSLYVIVFGFVLLAVVAMSLYQPVSTGEEYTYSMLLQQLENNMVARLEIQKDSEIYDSASVKVTFRDRAVPAAVLEIINLDSFIQNHAEPAHAMYGTVLETVLPPKTSWLASFLPTLIIMVVTMFFMFFILQQMQGGGGSKVMSFGKSRAKAAVDDKRKITFEKVAGLEEEKTELKEIVDFLKSPKKFVDMGARIPKGVLLVGPPGTGKTLLAKAVAGEAGVPFFSISGSDFVEMFVGVGASRVRDLFEQAKRNSPCIVFIDEIDAVGRKRGAGLGGGHDEREQTLNQLLVEMDGFGVNEGVIILAATNRADILDPAILRPGRFDRRVVVGRPDVKGREEILHVHAKGKRISPDIDLKSIAQTTSGFTGADLENLLNEAAILAARDNKKDISTDELRRAFVKIGIGTEKKSRIISEKERKITAYHEAGHAILFEMLTEIDSVHMISIIPTGSAGGYTMPLPSEDRGYITKKYMEQTIISLMGGRAAEMTVTGDMTSGASSDIEKATAIAREMVTKFGMSDTLGPINYGSENNEVFIGRDWGHTRTYGENVAGLIDSEMKRIINGAHNEAMRIIEENIDILHKTVDLLIEKERVTGDEFRSLFPEGVLPEKPRNEAAASAVIAPPESPVRGDASEGHTEKV